MNVIKGTFENVSYKLFHVWLQKIVCWFRLSLPIYFGYIYVFIVYIDFLGQQPVCCTTSAHNDKADIYSFELRKQIINT